MIFSRIIAGVDQSIRRSTRKPRLNQDENRWTKSASTAREVVAVVQRVEQLLAHAHQRGGAAGREIEPAQATPAGAARRRDAVRPRPCVGRRRPARPRWRHRCARGRGRTVVASASKKAMRGPMVSSAYSARISSRERHAGGLAAARTAIPRTARPGSSERCVATARGGRARDRAARGRARRCFAAFRRRTRCSPPMVPSLAGSRQSNESPKDDKLATSGAPRLWTKSRRQATEVPRGLP